VEINKFDRQPFLCSKSASPEGNTPHPVKPGEFLLRAFGRANQPIPVCGNKSVVSGYLVWHHNFA
jgi:hypothetical protein